MDVKELTLLSELAGDIDPTCVVIVLNIYVCVLFLTGLYLLNRGYMPL